MNNTTNEKPSEPKIDVKAIRAMLEEVLDTKLGEQETHLIDGIGKLLKGERDKTHSVIYEIAMWLAGKFKRQ